MVNHEGYMYLSTFQVKLGLGIALTSTHHDQSLCDLVHYSAKLRMALILREYFIINVEKWI